MSIYENILVAVDFSEHSSKALARAQALAKLSDAKVSLVHVVEVPVYPILEDIAVTGMPGVWDSEFTDNIVEASDKKLQLMAGQNDIAHSMTIVGTAGDEIVSLATVNKADLIVMGFHGATGLSRLMGSTTHSVLNDAPCDVLAVKLDD